MWYAKSSAEHSAESVTNEQYSINPTKKTLLQINNEIVVFKSVVAVRVVIQLLLKITEAVKYK